MSYLRLRALGGLDVADRCGRRMPIAGSYRPILGYLLTHRHRRVSKLELAETLWSDRGGRHARHCLATALWRLKGAVGPAAPLLVFDGNDDVSFNWSAPMWVDSIALEMRVAPLIRRTPESLGRAQIARLQRGVRLYRGDYLAGMDQEWAWVERQRLRELYCDGLYQLVTAHAAACEWEQVFEWGRRLSREEPLREDVHRWLMLACMHTGNRAAAIAQYRHCRRVLAEELGVAPMAETEEIYRRLVVRQAPAGPAAPAVPADALRRRVGRVRRLLVVCQRELDRALDQLDRSA